VRLCKKIFLSMAMILLFSFVSAMTTSLDAQAAIWHAGTPKVLRHKWVNKTTGWHFYKKQVVVWDRTVGWAATSRPWINVRYQKLGKNKYKTHAYCPHDDRHYTTTWKLSSNHRSIKVNGGTYYQSN